jgi:hypothetical protein
MARASRHEETIGDNFIALERTSDEAVVDSVRERNRTPFGGRSSGLSGTITPNEFRGAVC